MLSNIAFRIPSRSTPSGATTFPLVVPPNFLLQASASSLESTVRRRLRTLSHNPPVAAAGAATRRSAKGNVVVVCRCGIGGRRHPALLECLKPVTTKTMRERHEASIAKEQLAIDALRPPPTTKTATKDADDSDEEMEEETKASKKKKKKSKFQAPVLDKEELEKRMMGDDELMEEQDEVQEGADWSDDDN